MNAQITTKELNAQMEASPKMNQFFFCAYQIT